MIINHKQAQEDVDMMNNYDHDRGVYVPAPAPGGDVSGRGELLGIGSPLLFHLLLLCHSPLSIVD